ncbi:MmgE/PrpD family protein [Peribacillus frigoritolerans]|uniref:MmgE/PrpD family protein n=1 Tax=Peribacillus frigoritolerans TaxID=450367 RepID=UPI0024162C9A|nr:MmgE/PrpD family protein [Peribacillus frigoritolerans]MDG4850572.1 MmgE/PrpD family protein [Peribacillus frigoritolerans]
MELSKLIADFVVCTKYEDLPDEVVEFTKYCILDYFASAIAGSNEAPIQMLRELIQEQGGHEQATLITGGKTSVTQAAFINGATSHIVELDDIHKASIIHAATVVIPAALALAEWKNRSGKDLILAIVLGYEACYRIGEAVTPSHYYYWHNTATCGTFGAAIAASKLLNLSENQIVHALGSAGTQAAGLWEFIEDGAMSKQLHPGKAAMNGVYSALLAEKGFTGASKILEGRRGFFEAMSETYDLNKVTEGLGAGFKITENSFKVHASCRHTHHVMDLAIDLMENEPLNPQNIERIRIKTYKVALDITDNLNPQSIYAAKFSIQFCTALALVKKSVGLEDFNEETLNNPEIRNLMNKIEVIIEPTINQLYPHQWGAKLEIDMIGGKQITKVTSFPKGDPENALTKEEYVKKFKKLTKEIVDFDELIESIESLEKVETIDGLLESLNTKIVRA